MAWWIWIITGLVLLALELFVPSGFFLLIGGLAAILTGILVLIGIGGVAWFQWLLCGVLLVVLLLYVRKHLVGKLSQGDAKSDRGLQGEEVTITRDLSPGDIGEGQMRGAVWMVRNIGDSIIRSGERCPVESIEGVTLKVRPPRPNH